MSLGISFISKNHDQKKEELESLLSDGHNYLFGFEIYRKQLWGHEVMKSLGCTLIHSLGEGHNIYVFDEDMEQLKDKMLKIISQIETIASKTGIEEDTIICRVKNVLEYIRVAQLSGENFGVTIG